MKKTILRLPAPLVGLGLMMAGSVTAQTFTTVHNFTNGDGAGPNELILSGNTLYGTARYGGILAYGSVFAVRTDGTGFTNLHSFTEPVDYTNSDGAYPLAGLVLSDNTLYGTAWQGGNSGDGTVFAISTNGAGFTNLHNFGGPFVNGSQPFGALISSGNTLYGTTAQGGSSGNGAVFAIHIDGTGYTNLYSFTAGSASLPQTNSDGATPPARLVLSGDTLYGPAARCGASGYGAVFAVHTDGSGFTNLHNFTTASGSFNPYGIGPGAGLVLSGNTLYGTAPEGGSSGNGTVFAVNTDGTGFTNLHHFTPLSGPYPSTNSDGAHPRAGLILSGNTLYGTAGGGGSSGNGTVFALKTDGTDFTVLYDFTATTYTNYTFTNSDGAGPNGLILSSTALYGTAGGGGSSGAGTVFSLTFAPQLAIVPSGVNVILTWPTNYAGFDYTGYTLQSAPVSTGTFTNLPSATSPYTNPIAGAQQFFRLISN